MVESLVGVALMTLISLLTLEAFHMGTRAINITRTSSRLTSEVRSGMEEMIRELHGSTLSRISVPQASILRFQIPSIISANGNITWSGLIQYSLGGVNGRQLLRQDLSTGATSAVANSITAVVFTRNVNPATLTIQMTAQGTTDYGTVIPIMLSSTVDLRN